MAENIKEERFLGVRWGSVWEAIAKPWRAAAQWRWIRAITPPASVLLHQHDGGQKVWCVEWSGAMHSQDSRGKQRTDFIAIGLPPTMVLHRSQTFPALDTPELMGAVALDVLANSPFPKEDLCWGHRIEPTQNGSGLRVHVALVSRRQVIEYLTALESRGLQSGHTPEIWAPSASGEGVYFVMPGYGEAERMSRQRMERGKNLAAIVVIAALLGLIAITPTLQLRARAIEAVHAYTALHERASTAVASREALVRKADQIQWVEGRLRETLEPAATINLLTRVLTDDTSLTALRITGRKVLLEGQTTNAAELMQLLGRQPGFQDVVAPVAATRPFGSSKDIFKIEFVLDPEQAFGEAGRPVQSTDPLGSQSGKQPS